MCCACTPALQRAWHCSTEGLPCITSLWSRSHRSLPGPHDSKRHLEAPSRCGDIASSLPKSNPPAAARAPLPPAPRFLPSAAALSAPCGDCCPGATLSPLLLCRISMPTPPPPPPPSTLRPLPCRRCCPPGSPPCTACTSVMSGLNCRMGPGPGYVASRKLAMLPHSMRKLGKGSQHRSCLQMACVKWTRPGTLGGSWSSAARNTGPWAAP